MAGVLSGIMDGDKFEFYQVKEMVERYGGVISVETQEGVGSSFSVSFTK